MSSPYLLIALVGDAQTRAALRVARLLAEQRPPGEGNFLGNDREFSNELPTDAQIRARLATLGPRPTVVICGHGGVDGFSATREPKPWLDLEAFKALFGGVRLYALACETLQEIEGVSFGARAVEGCVQTFVGHTNAVAVNFLHLPDNLLQALHEAMSAALVAFVDGTDDPKRLRESVLDYDIDGSAEGLAVFLDFDSAYPDYESEQLDAQIKRKRFADSLDARSK